MAKKSGKGRDEYLNATIRIQYGLWADFQEWAKSQGSNASFKVIDYIQRCLDTDADVNTDADADADDVDTDADDVDTDADDVDTDVNTDADDVDTDDVDTDADDVDTDDVDTDDADTDIITDTDDTDTPDNSTPDKTLQGVLAITASPAVPLVTGMIDAAVNERLGGKVQQLEVALFEFDSKVENASKRATDTAVAFIDERIEKAIAPLLARVGKLEEANLDLVSRNQQLMSRLAETLAVTNDSSAWENYHQHYCAPAINDAIADLAENFNAKITAISAATAGGLQAAEDGINAALARTENIVSAIAMLADGEDVDNEDWETITVPALSPPPTEPVTPLQPVTPLEQIKGKTKMMERLGMTSREDKRQFELNFLSVEWLAALGWQIVGEPAKKGDAYIFQRCP